METVTRRTVLAAIGAGGVAGLAGCSSTSSCPDPEKPHPDRTVETTAKPVGGLATAPSTDWPSPRHDSRNSGFVPERTVPDSPALRWRSRVQDSGLSIPVAANGRLFVLSGQRLYALDLRDGSTVWQTDQITTNSFDTEEIFGRSMWTGLIPPVADGNGTVYVGGGSRLTAVDTSDGTVRWQYTDARNLGVPAVDSGTVYVSAETGILALDAASGKRHWESNVAATPSVLGVADETLVVSSRSVPEKTPSVTEKNTVAVETATGEIRWKARADIHGSSYPVISDGVVYLGGYRLHAVDFDTGEFRWSFSRDYGLTYTTPVVTDDSLYTVEIPDTDHSAMFALDRAESEPSPRWCSNVSEGTVVAATSDRALSVSGADDGLYAFDAGLGDSQWYLERTHTRQPLVLDGLVVAAGSQGSIVAVGEHDS